MNRTELTSLLSQIAEKDLAEGNDINDHPCSVAIRDLEGLEKALIRAQEDINWMINERTFLNGFVFDYIDAAIKGE